MTRRTFQFCGRLLVPVLLMTIEPSWAHERSSSFATLLPDRDGVEIELQMGARDLTRLPAFVQGERAAARLVAEAFLVRRGGADCTAEAPPDSRALAEGRTLVRWRVACPPGELEIESQLSSFLRTPHLCFVRVSGQSEVLLHEGRPRWRQGEGEHAGSWLEFLRLGVEHIAGGADHLLFLLGLLVASVALGEVVVVITAFTLAHTLTLGAAVLGLLQPAPVAVEALIAASIAVLGVENLALRCGNAAGGNAQKAVWLLMVPVLLAATLGVGRVSGQAIGGTALFALCYLGLAARHPEHRRLRWLVAFVFGLLHGFGFAGALAESGFAKESVPTMLLGFNCGVELGQLALVAAFWPFLQLLQRRSRAGYIRWVLEPVSVVLLASGVAWYGVRAFG